MGYVSVSISLVLSLISYHRLLRHRRRVLAPSRYNTVPCLPFGSLQAGQRLLLLHVSRAGRHPGRDNHRHGNLWIPMAVLDAPLPHRHPAAPPPLLTRPTMGRPRFLAHAPAPKEAYPPPEGRQRVRRR